MQNWALRTKSGGNTGNRIGTTGPGRGNHAAEFTGLPGVAISRMRGSLFMSNIDNTNTFIEATIVNINNVTAAKRKYGVDTFGLQSFGNQMATRYHRAVFGFLF